MRLIARKVYIGAERDRFGCVQADCTCPKHLRLELPEVDVEALWMRRLRFLTRLEAMVNVGCRFGPNDLAPLLWDELIIIAQERQYVERLSQAFREWLSSSSRAEQDAHAKLRAQTGVPPPGQSLFGAPARRRR